MTQYLRLCCVCQQALEPINILTGDKIMVSHGLDRICELGQLVKSSLATIDEVKELRNLEARQ